MAVQKGKHSGSGTRPSGKGGSSSSEGRSKSPSRSKKTTSYVRIDTMGASHEQKSAIKELSAQSSQPDSDKERKTSSQDKKKRDLKGSEDRSQGSEGRSKKTSSRTKSASTIPSSSGRGRHQKTEEAGAGGTPSSASPTEVARLRALKRARSKRWPLITAAIVAVLLVLVGVSSLVLISSAKSMKAQAESMVEDVTLIATNAMGGDGAAALDAAEHIQTTANALDAELSSPLWAVASVLPVVGSDVQGVHSLVNILQDAADNALVPLTSTLSEYPLTSLVGEDQAVNVAGVQALLGVVEEAAPVMDRCNEALQAIAPMNMEQLQSVIEPAKVKMAEANQQFQELVVFAPMASAFLGVDGNKTYLLVAQNTAEMRSSGGFPGSVGTLVIAEGKISLGDFGSVYKVFADETNEAFPSNESDRLLFWDRMEVPRDAGFNPDFPRVAAIWAQAYADKTGQPVNGVISITPTVIQDLIGLTGPITLYDGTVVDDTNATEILQNTLYWRYLSRGLWSEANDAFTDALFAQTAGLAFQQLFSDLSGEKLMKVAELFFKAFDTREILLWLADPVDQETVLAAGVGGALNDDPTKPEIGIFFNIGLASKLGWYADELIHMGEPVENVDGSTTYPFVVKFVNTISLEEAEDAGSYIAGHESYLGNMLPLIYFFAPYGGFLSDFSAVYNSTGESIDFDTCEYDELQVIYARYIWMPAKEGITCYFNVTTSPEAQEPLKVVTQPTLTAYHNPQALVDWDNWWKQQDEAAQAAEAAVEDDAAAVADEGDAGASASEEGAGASADTDDTAQPQAA